VDGATVVKTDILAGNGVIHVIDTDNRRAVSTRAEAEPPLVAAEVR
jgi:hypothetical protein